ncbi:MAG: methylenetetrahydrofolate--tRNA-(uracil(54)-C(5))-methyltransferase (FADH(2)-oxidizing) TrmFO [Clostridiales bacterium]|nr:methylenetetrahydrofolate--tRNA-(uracil(54)-C(5))-methyltransferase (FADH(2)-oxidizing) TrmFO [Clostridiales bacterium]
MKIKIIGAGLAGCEAAYYLAERGVEVTLYDIKPNKFTPAHKNKNLGELVCSNSLKSSDTFANACALLKEEMRLLGSLMMEAAQSTKIPAGGALAVDRDEFASYITEKIFSHKNIKFISEEISSLPQGEFCIVATGPLTTDSLSGDIQRALGSGLHFYDASAPIVSKDSIDFSNCFYGDRYGKGGDDYINCPLDKDTYISFVEALISAEKALLHEFEKKEIFEGCMPVEIMAARGIDTLRFGPFKPVGLQDENGNKFYAVMQLRKENSQGTAYNLVGCQTNLKFPEQKRVFSMIPALKNAEFLRYGVMHRNTYLNAPDFLNADFSLKEDGKVFFAGQITGVEGYVESAASGLLCAIHALNKLNGKQPIIPEDITVLGALSAHICTPNKNYQPMNANFGILRQAEKRIKDKKERYRYLAERALQSIKKYKEEINL